MTGRNGRLRTGYLGGTPEVMMMFEQPSVGPRKKSMGYPQPSGFIQNKTCFTNVFNKDIEMLYPREKLLSKKLFLSQQRYRGV